jgi:hypothetical protein
MFKEHIAGKAPEIQGSWVLIQASSKEEAVELLQRDPFTTGNVWDWGKSQVLCVKSGLRVPFVKPSVKASLERNQA